MSDSRAIIEAIQKIAKVRNEDKVYYSTGVVKSVDTDAATCEVEIENSIVLHNVQLQAAVCDGLMLTPVVGSNVGVLFSLRTPATVVQYSDIDEMYVQVGDSSFTMNNDGTQQFNDGSYDGWVKVGDLTTKLNDLENKVNELINALRAVVIPLAPSGTYPFAPIFNPVQTLTPTQQQDIENDKITHGK